MNKSKGVLISIIGVIALLVAIVGLVIANQRNVTDTSTANSQEEMSSETTDTQDTTSDDPLASLSVYEGSYTILITGSEASGTANPLGMIQVESTGRSRTVITDPEQGTVEFIVDGDMYYSYSEESGWLTYSNELNGSGTAYTDNYVIDAKAIEAIEKDAIRIDDEACGDNTCAVYKSTVEGEEATVKVDVTNGRIVELKSEDPTYGTITLTYDYDTPVTIEIPTDAKDVSELMTNPTDGQ